MNKGIVEINFESEPKFKVGNWIIHQGTENIYQVVAIIDNQYQLKYGDTYTVQNCVDVDRCARLWDISKDAKDGDVLINWNNAIFIFKAIEDETVKFHIAYNEKWDTIKTPSTKSSHLGLPEPQFEFHPATKEQKELLFNAMFEAGYLWDLDNHKLVKKPNPIKVIEKPTIPMENEGELTEFEKTLFRTFSVTWNSGGYYPTEVVKLHAQELLSVAEKEIRKKIVSEIDVDKMITEAYGDYIPKSGFMRSLMNSVMVAYNQGITDVLQKINKL